MNRETLLDTIRRLLALAGKNPNEHEAQLAAAKAAELMRRHQIDAAQIEASAPQEWVMECVEEYRRVPFEAQVLGALLDRHFLVEVFTDDRLRPVTGRTKIQIFGKPEHVAVAVYTYQVLLRVFRALANEKLGVCTTTVLKSYYVGLQEGFAMAILRQRREVERQVARQEEAIIQQHRNDCAQALTKLHGLRGESRSQQFSADRDVYEQGKRDGAEIQVHTPLPTGPTVSPRRIGVG